MRDFPVFSTENGVGSLTLREIPYTNCAYLRIQSLTRRAFIEECSAFCKAVGACHLYGTGDSILKEYPFHTAIWEMSGQKAEQYRASLFPVTDSTAEEWRQLYNQRMMDIPNAAYMSILSMQNLVKKGEAYFVHDNGRLLGIGSINENRITSIVSKERGAGDIILDTLSSLSQENQILLEVASENKRAIRLYERAGFIKIREIAQWYKIF